MKIFIKIWKYAEYVIWFLEITVNLNSTYKHIRGSMCVKYAEKLFKHKIMLIFTFKAFIMIRCPTNVNFVSTNRNGINNLKIIKIIVQCLLKNFKQFIRVNLKIIVIKTLSDKKYANVVVGSLNQFSHSISMKKYIQIGLI